MTFDLDSLGGYPSADPSDHWLDAALRAVPLPDGFYQRISTLADLPARAAGLGESSPFVRPDPAESACPADSTLLRWGASRGYNRPR